MKISDNRNKEHFTTTTKHTAGGLGSAFEFTSVISNGSNSMSSNSMAGVVLIARASNIPAVEIGIDFGVNYDMDSSDKLGTCVDLGDVVVCLGIALAIVVGLVFFQLNIVAPISPTSCSHLTLIFSVIQVDQAIMLLVCFFLPCLYLRQLWYLQFSGFLNIRKIFQFTNICLRQHLQIKSRRNIY